MALGTTLSLWLYLPTGTVFFDDVSIPGLPGSVPSGRETIFMNMSMQCVMGKAGHWSDMVI